MKVVKITKTIITIKAVHNEPPLLLYIINPKV